MNRIISLLTDFGTQDGYVGTMKGVIHSICLDAKIVDLSHEIERQNINQASFVIASSYRYFPEGTVHMIVVDPGVGSERRVICAQCDGHLFLAPDNGVLCHIFDKNDRTEVVSVTDRSLFLKDISRTFHGRDIFSPVAANLANGLSIEELGPGINDYQKGEVARPEEIENGITGEVIHIDRFGNMITNVENSSLSEHASGVLMIKGTKVRAVSFYSEGNPGEPVVLPGSCGFLEIAVNAGNAADVLNSEIGTKVSVFWS